MAATGNIFLNFISDHFLKTKIFQKHSDNMCKVYILQKKKKKSTVVDMFCIGKFHIGQVTEKILSMLLFS